MGKDYLIKCLLEDKPYFGNLLAARQGVAERHAYMQAIVELYSRNCRKNDIRILEIGSWAGMSTVTWAVAMQKYFKKGHIDCIDLWEPYLNLKVNTEDVYHSMNQALETRQIFNLFKHNIKACRFNDCVKILFGKSRDILPTLLNKTYDIVFIDGSHLFADVFFDIKEAKRIIKDGGFICGDDLEIELNKVDLKTHMGNLENEKDFIFDKKIGIGYHPGVTEAVGRQFEKTAVWEGFWAIQKIGSKWNYRIDLDQRAIELPAHLKNFDDDLSRGDALDELAERVQLVEELSLFNIIKIEDRYIAVAKSLGQMNLFDERIGEKEIHPYIFIADTIEAIRKKVMEVFPEPDLLEDNINNSILKIDGRYVTVSKFLGPIDFATEKIGQRELSPHIFISDTLDEARQKAKQISSTIEQIGDTDTHSILKLKGQYIAVHKSLGPIDFTTEKIGQRELPPYIFISDTLDGVKQKIVQNLSKIDRNA